MTEDAILLLYWAQRQLIRPAEYLQYQNEPNFVDWRLSREADMMRQRKREDVELRDQAYDDGFDDGAATARRQTIDIPSRHRNHRRFYDSYHSSYSAMSVTSEDSYDSCRPRRRYRKKRSGRRRKIKPQKKTDHEKGAIVGQNEAPVMNKFGHDDSKFEALGNAIERGNCGEAKRLYAEIIEEFKKASKGRHVAAVKEEDKRPTRGRHDPVIEEDDRESSKGRHDGAVEEEDKKPRKGRHDP